MASTGLLVLVACSFDTEEEQILPVAKAESEREPALAVRAEDPRSSVVLIVLDTLRADAVSSYGVVDGTTPALDRLADEGIRYTRAYAPGPWTIPSHATLFSGLRIDEHGVGLAGAQVAPDALQMLAEDFSEAGYLTAGFSENMLVSKTFGLDQGFDVFESTSIFKIRESLDAGEIPDGIDLIDRIGQWNRLRDKTRPFFLFVNIINAHDPYVVRDVNRWIPENMRRDEAEFVQSKYFIPISLCDGAPVKEHLEVLRGLYLGNVAAADAKLDAVLRILGRENDSDSYLMVTTSDHGEHLGENRLMGHRFSVRNSVLHIPLIVSGLPDVVPSIIERPVALRQVYDSLLCWALGEECDKNLPITNSSSAIESESSEPIFSIYSDSVAEPPKWLIENLNIPNYGSMMKNSRSTCKTQDRVFGDMVSMIRYPMKITWFEEYEPVLHDLSWDSKERFDQIGGQSELALELRSEIEEFVRVNVTGRERKQLPELSEEGLRALKSLGYVQ